MINRDVERDVARIIGCTECGQGVAAIAGDNIIIKRNHHGKTHVTVITLEHIVRHSNGNELRRSLRVL